MTRENPMRIPALLIAGLCEAMDLPPVRVEVLAAARKMLCLPNALRTNR